MVIYLDLVIVLNLLVDFMLLMGTNRLSGFPVNIWRCAAASFCGGMYGGACLLPGFRFLSGVFWRIVFLSLIGSFAFGIKVSALRRTCLFVILSMSMGGIAVTLNSGSFWYLAAAAGIVWLLCSISFRDPVGARRYLPLTLEYRGSRVSLTALYDTGNCLRDPVSGDAVYLVGADAAYSLVGLTAAQLRDPYGTILCKPVPGLKMIPFRAVGRECGMLLGLRVDNVFLGSVRKNAVVAFTADGLGVEDCQALVGAD